MKLLCEFKRNSAQELIIGWAPRSVGIDADYQIINTHLKRVSKLTCDALQSSLQSYGLTCRDIDIVRRLSRKENIGAFIATVYHFIHVDL